MFFSNDCIHLNEVKCQRFTELLDNHIPKNEVKVFNDGRLTCIVCYNHPVFETVEVLSKHRQGKKHLLELSRYILRKQKELEIEAEENRELLHTEINMVSIISPGGLGSILDQHTDQFGRRKKSFEWTSTPRKLFYKPEPYKSLITKTEMLSPIQRSTNKARDYIRSIPKKKSFKTLKKVSANGILTAGSIKIEVTNPDSPTPIIKTGAEVSINWRDYIRNDKGHYVKDPKKIKEFDE